MKQVKTLIKALSLAAAVAFSALGTLWMITAQAHTLFPVGTEADSVDLTETPGAVPYEGGWAIPLAGDRPAWFTPSLEQQVLAAAGTPVAAPIDAPLPSEVGIRPGSWMVSPAGCTMNFVFRKNGAFAIGTAGHCVDKLGQGVVLLTLAPGGANPVLADIGAVIARRDNGIGDDFALVSIRPELNAWVSPTTALIGGPCGRYAGSGLDGGTLRPRLSHRHRRDAAGGLRPHLEDGRVRVGRLGHLRRLGQPRPCDRLEGRGQSHPPRCRYALAAKFRGGHADQQDAPDREGVDAGRQPSLPMMRWHRGSRREMAAALQAMRANLINVIPA